MNKFIAFAVIGVALAGCTDAGRAQLGALGSAGEITCYSGGQVILQDKSTGKIATEEGSDGWYYNSATTNKLIRVSGTCVVKN